MVFQDPYGALNPLQKVGEIIAEPLRIHRLALRGHERHTRVLQALEEVGLRPPEAYLERRPHELSGGQRQRVIIASALVLEPSVLIADEPVTMLDPAMRAEILSVLAELRRQRALSILLISHDLDTVAALADRVAVMSLGRIVELGTVDEVLKNRLCLR
jgi:ABC-type dipeptide/oligopeptide/nickel transport system ATPase component